MTDYDPQAELQRTQNLVRQALESLSSTKLPDVARNLSQTMRQALKTKEMLERTVKQIFEGFDQWRNDSERFLQIMLEMGWPPPAHVPASLVTIVVRAEEEGRLDKEELAAALVDWYEPDDLRGMLEGWRERDWLAQRMHILESAVEAHIRGEFTLSVPGILPQVDGIIGDAFGHKGKLYGPDLEDYIEELLAEDRPSSFRDATRAFWLETLRADAPFGAAPPELSRHAILHGVDTEYAEESKSLRVILLFDRVQESINYVATEQGGRYHTPGCSHLGPPRSNRIVFVSKHEVEKQTRLTPCQVCKPE